jgi:hypothetical protein
MRLSHTSYEHLIPSFIANGINTYAGSSHIYTDSINLNTRTYLDGNSQDQHT